MFNFDVEYSVFCFPPNHFSLFTTNFCLPPQLLLLAATMSNHPRSSPNGDGNSLSLAHNASRTSIHRINNIISPAPPSSNRNAGRITMKDDVVLSVDEVPEKFP
jgi:hypothetical protein